MKIDYVTREYVDDGFEKMEQYIDNSFIAFEGKMDKKFDAIDRRFDAIDQRFEEFDKKLIMTEDRIVSRVTANIIKELK